MDEATIPQNDEVVDTIEKPKRKATKKQLESLEKARKRKTELQKERRSDSKQTQQLMNSYVEQNTFNTGLKEQMNSLTKQMDDMRGLINHKPEFEETVVDEESEYETDEEYSPNENTFKFV